MKKFILSVLAVSLTAGAFAQELSKEEQKALKEQQKAITANLKAAEKAAKLSETAEGQVDYSKVPDFATARAQVAEAFKNSAANTMLGDINRVAGNIEYNELQINTPGAQQSDPVALGKFFDNCAKGFTYYNNAYNAYATPDAKGKTNPKYNDDMAAKAWNMYRSSNGLSSCALTAYQNQNWKEAAEYFELAALGSECPMFTSSKNLEIIAGLPEFTADSVKYQNILYAGTTYSNFDKLKAVSVLKSLIGKNIEQNQVYATIYQQYAELKDTTEMINWLQLGMEALPNESSYGEALLQIYLARQDIDGAMSATNSRLAKNPNSVSDIILLGRLYAWKGDLEDYNGMSVEQMNETFARVYGPAEELYKKALLIDPNSLDANLYYSQLFMLKMDKAEGVMMKNHKDALFDQYQNECSEVILPLLRKAYQLDTKHENNDVCNWLTQTLYKKFTPSSCPAAEKATLKAEYQEVRAAYGR